MFRAKKLDLSGFVNIKTIRDHTKRSAPATLVPYPRLTAPRKVFEKHETERYALYLPFLKVHPQTLPSYTSLPSAVPSAPADSDAQASPPLYNPQHHPTPTNARSSPAPTLANALLYTTDTDTE